MGSVLSADIDGSWSARTAEPGSIFDIFTHLPERTRTATAAVRNGSISVTSIAILGSTSYA